MAMARLRSEDGSEARPAAFIDDYFGRHEYGVQFLKEVSVGWKPHGKVYTVDEIIYDPLAEVPKEVEQTVSLITCKSKIGGSNE
jgi:hypothetical protein